ncbi:hypothetical protein K503DRAFT_178495 [Rhizopogon vinicolor AM-OR11-026]|uniref:Uncharacterized protein n=1 Tax=Rhizopogon vinicolor AM-OR11-026 TaxID=1314800 RepID=A0A1B7MDR1_9AGAM|nr:hypothetical protein K503DRAFT_178495 [Rhizopogon vinicolor AM-OR11-026]
MLGQRSIKLIHSLFEAKKSESNERSGWWSSMITMTKILPSQPVSSKQPIGTIVIFLTDRFATTDSIGSDFNIGTWPVADRCKDHLQDLISTHEIRPLPAYDENHALIPPLQYESKLKGALVEVHMSIYHHRFKSKKRDVSSLYCGN